MINILKQGTLPPITKIIYKTVCNKCGCEFEFDVEDAMVERRPNGNMSVKCPHCEHLIKNKRDSFESRELKINIICGESPNITNNGYAFDILFKKLNISVYNTRHNDTGYELCIKEKNDIFAAAYAEIEEKEYIALKDVLDRLEKNNDEN